jgi:hypothetical protein
MPVAAGISAVAVRDVRDARTDRRDARAAGSFERRVWSWTMTREAWRAFVLSVALIAITVSIAVVVVIDLAS